MAFLSQSPGNLKKKQKKAEEERDHSTPMVEIFGSTFALLLILFLILNLLTESKILTILEESPDKGAYRIDWGNQGSGYVILSFPDRIKILERNQSVASDQICENDSAFLEYVQKIYTQDAYLDANRNIRQQIVFAIVEGGVHTMATARNCLRNSFPRPVSIGWIIANDEFLKAISVNEIPYYIQNATKKN